MKNKNVVVFAMLMMCMLTGCHKNGIQKSETTYIHISLDDVELSISNLANSRVISIWDEPLFAELKRLHNEYGAVFSLYVFEDTFSKIESKYACDLYDTADWLKFGFHSSTITEKLGSDSTYEEGKEEWNSFVQDVTRVTGTAESIDKIPRLHYYSGSKECLDGMRDSDNGALGFLAADDDRISYYLTTEENEYLQKNDCFYDSQESLVFLKTDMRGDWFDRSFSSENHYDAPKFNDVYKELERRFSSDLFNRQTESYIWFCHEQKIYDGKSLNENIVWIEDVCRFAKDNSISFDYPQNRIKSLAN